MIWKSNNIARQTLILFLGMMISAGVLLQVVYSPSLVEDRQDFTEQGDTNDNQSDVTISPSQAIPNSTTQINLGFDSYLLDEVKFNKETDEKPTASELIASGVHEAIRVLLQKIISPNAP